MKRFLIQSPCYRANGKNGIEYSIAFTDESGNVVKGFGAHISPNSFGVKNVYESEGTSFSDSDRLITIKEVNILESDFDNFINSYSKHNELLDKWNEEKLKLFGDDPHSFIYSKNKGQSERLNSYLEWVRKNPIPFFNYYSFLDLIK